MKKRKSNYIILLAFAVLIIAIMILAFSNNSGKIETDKISTPEENTMGTVDEGGEGYFNGEKSESHIIKIYPSESWIYPRLLRIKQGDTVVFVNQGSETHWIASNPHIGHDAYPGSNIDKCGTVEESNIFDSCKGINPGEDYTFTFYEKGTWKYHDHLRASISGTIIVG